MTHSRPEPPIQPRLQWINLPGMDINDYRHILTRGTRDTDTCVPKRQESQIPAPAHRPIAFAREAKCRDGKLQDWTRGSRKTERGSRCVGDAVHVMLDGEYARVV